jgi:cyclopropane fatty-acyl-phospholipid synthase-like methyltransferase
MDAHVSKTIATYDVIAPHYRVTATPELRAWEESSMRLFASYLRGSRVLVPGCGDGRDSRYLSSLGLDVWSFDLSDGMLAEARTLDVRGRYVKLDLRDVASLGQTFDGVFASGCLYHLRRDEFATFVHDISAMLEPGAVFYLNLKIGTGEEYRAVPGDQYPGGAQARQLLQGERYYVYYQRQELAQYFRPYQRLHERELQHAEEVVEFWLRKNPEA